MQEIPPFLHLGQVPQMPRGFATALRERKLDAAYVTRVIRSEELFETSAPLDDDTPQALRHQRWLYRLLDSWGLPPALPLNGLLSFLEFQDVGTHTDGELTIVTEDDVAQPSYYANVQMRGSGRITVDGQAHAIEPGEVYMFDQRLEHAWENTSACRSRVLSFWLTETQVLAIQERRRALSA